MRARDADRAASETDGEVRESGMPLYEYKCDGCDEVFFELRPSKEREDPIRCPDCGGEGHVVFSTFAQGAQPETCSRKERCTSGPT